MPGTITVSAVSSSSSAVVGQHLEAGPGCAPGRRPGVQTRDRVERRAGGVPGGAEDLGRGAEVERDHVVEGEDGDPVRDASWPDYCA